MWMCVSVLQEAVSTGDPELVQLMLQYRDYKRATERLAGIPELLSKLRQVNRFHLAISFKYVSLQVLKSCLLHRAHKPRLRAVFV